MADQTMMTDLMELAGQTMMADQMELADQAMMADQMELADQAMMADQMELADQAIKQTERMEVVSDLRRAMPVYVGARGDSNRWVLVVEFTSPGAGARVFHEVPNPGRYSYSEWVQLAAGLRRVMYFDNSVDRYLQVFGDDVEFVAAGRNDLNPQTVLRIPRKQLAAPLLFAVADAKARGLPFRDERLPLDEEARKLEEGL